MPTLNLDATDSVLSIKNGGGGYDGPFSGGNTSFGVDAGGGRFRLAFKFDLSTLPGGSTVTAISAQFTNIAKFGSRDAFDAREYGSAGTDNPSSDSADDVWNRIGNGALLVDNDAQLDAVGATVT